MCLCDFWLVRLPSLTHPHDCRCPRPSTWCHWLNSFVFAVLPKPHRQIFSWCCVSHSWEGGKNLLQPVVMRLSQTKTLKTALPLMVFLMLALWKPLMFKCLTLSLFRETCMDWTDWVIWPELVLAGSSLKHSGVQLATSRHDRTNGPTWGHCLEIIMFHNSCKSRSTTNPHSPQSW